VATVLIVEDERKLRDFVRSYLERAGCIVLSTGSGVEAIAMAAEAPAGTRRFSAASPAPLSSTHRRGST
jgi:CheY-like chemotaxis protein